MSDIVDKEKLKTDAGLQYLPTDLTYELRMAVTGYKKDEFLSWSYQWEDKPHRLVYAACCEAEAQADTITRLTAEVRVRQTIVEEARDERDAALAEMEKLRAALGRWLDAVNDKRAFEHHQPDNLGKEWSRLREAVDLAEDNARAALEEMRLQDRPKDRPNSSKENNNV
jgi:hypothetical protein